MAKQIKKRLTFQEAVAATPDIAKCYQNGLKGLGVHSAKIELQDTKLCGGSVDIDVCTITKYPNSNRWDYVLSYKEKVHFVEVHGARTDEVKKMLKKLQWLKDWLNEQAPELNKLKAEKPFHWIQSSNFTILKSSKQYQMAAGAGLLPKAKLSL